MEFEIIDESEIVFARKPKKKKVESLFDSALIDRNYWGWQDGPNGTKVLDPGTQLAMASMRGLIRRSVRKGIIVDVDDTLPARRLNSEFIDELIEFQNQCIVDLVNEGVISAHLDKKKNWVIDEVLEVD